MNSPKKIRNIAIVAHVDHGKTTLVDSMFRQSGIFRENQIIKARVLDSDPLEEERGITILAKNTAIKYQGFKINILDTPGHADFSGEVERVLNMVDGVLLIIDAVEGPRPQTRFVLTKALENKLKVIVVVNKIDRENADPDKALDKTFDLFIELGATEQQLEFPIVYASGFAGKAGLKLDKIKENLTDLFDCILKEIPEPDGSTDNPLQMQVATLDYSDYLGKIIIGRIKNGRLKIGDKIALSHRGKLSSAKVSALYSFEGLHKLEVDSASAGEIVALAGVEDAQIGDSIVDQLNPQPLSEIKIEEPTLQTTFSVNSSPFAGQEGKFVTSRQLRERLFKEVKTNVSLKVEETEHPEKFLVSGRGELHLAVLIENLRREGFEFSVSKAKVIFKKDSENKRLEPQETLTLDVPEETSGACLELLGKRKALLEKMDSSQGRAHLEFKITSRALLGLRSQLIKITRGQGLISSAFDSYQEFTGEIELSEHGSLVSHETGTATEYALKNLEDRGLFFIKPGEKVYRGMIIGKNSRSQDLVINVCKNKKLTNMRSAGAEFLDSLAKSVELTLEYALDYLAGSTKEDLLEVTPSSIRLRKANLLV